MASRKKWAPIGIIAIALATVVVAGGVGVYFAIPFITKKAALAAQRSDSSNMIAIAEALNAYALRYGTYPTPVVKDNSGTPLYSWRVLILPFLGYQQLYDRFQLDQPYDSPANLSLAIEMPRVFASSFTGSGNVDQTNYSLLVGPGTLFPASGPLSPADAEDPTILVVETNDGMCSWSEPMDIDVGKGLSIGSKPMKHIGGIHKGVAIVVTVKEEAYAIPATNSQVLVDALVTPKGGETADLSAAVKL
ncbi:MAG: DUF1559 domain-containing protein [Pirellula sp.]|nr:DUF1559 domain-containing protein [Pirellula sp.]